MLPQLFIWFNKHYDTSEPAFCIIFDFSKSLANLVTLERPTRSWSVSHLIFGIQTNKCVTHRFVCTCIYLFAQETNKRSDWTGQNSKRGQKVWSWCNAVNAITVFEFENVSNSQVGCLNLSEGTRMCKFWGEKMTTKGNKTYMFLTKSNTSRTWVLNSRITNVPESPSEIDWSLEIISTSPLNVSKEGQEGMPNAKTLRDTRRVVCGSFD